MVSDVLLIKQNLSLQIRQIHKVAIDDSQKSHSGANQSISQHRPQGAAATKQHPGRSNSLLSVEANSGKANLATISVQVITVHRRIGHGFPFQWRNASRGIPEIRHCSAFSLPLDQSVRSTITRSTISSCVCASRLSSKPIARAIASSVQTPDSCR